MAGKLDQSLDDIVKTRRTSARRGTRSARRGIGRTSGATATPVGGVAKPTKTSKAGKTAIPSGPVAGSGESKIIVSGLPSDVTDTQIKDYFSKTIGPVKRVFLTYGPDGRSRGIATIAFAKPGSASEAASQLNGVKVDNKAMKIEVILSAAQAPAPVPPKGLGDRIGQPKSAAKAQPKPATATKNTGGTTTGSRGRGRRGRNAGRGKPKTAQELDAEMVDYFDANAAESNATTSATNGAGNPAVATGGDTGMDDEIL